MFKLIKKNKFKLYVFDFTLDEARNVLNRCPYEIESSDNIKINSICAHLKKEHKTDSEIQYISSNLKELLKKQDIEVWKTGISVPSYVPKDRELYALLIDRKPNQPIQPRLRDVAAVDYIRDLRKNKPISKLSESKALFLTTDRILTKAVNDAYHKVDNTISEVILDKLLTNLLWLNDPSISLNIESIVASCCKDVFVNRDVWETFVNVFNELKNKGELTEDDYRSLFYLNYLEETLSGYTQRELAKITPEFVKSSVNVQKSRLEQMNNKLKVLIDNYILIFRVSLFSLLFLLLVLITVLFIFAKLVELKIVLFLAFITASLLFAAFKGWGPFGKIWDMMTKKIIDHFDAQGEIR